MAVFKSSNATPTLTEIDFEESNVFSCQVNTSGESVQAYKIQILSGRGDEIIIDGNNNDGKGTNLVDEGKRPIKNKGFLDIPDSNFKNSSLVNGKDYQWGIRTYAAPINSTAQPKTLVCSGFLVGSTQYIIWVNLDTDNETKDNMNNLLQYDRYIEFKIPKSEITSKILPFTSSYETDVTYPPEPNDPSQSYYIQRRKIDWVEKELGQDKKITKIETEENFDYNFADGTQFSIYLCSDQHTPNAIYVDPNDIIEPSNYIVIYNSKTEYDAAKNDATNVNDPTKGTIRNTLRKIYGYSSDTGEIRVQEAYGDENDPVPVNGNYYRIFEYDMVNKTYTEKTGSVEQVVGGSPLKDSNNLFKVYSNKWSGAGVEDNRLFIQPNINIKIDRTNYNEIVFDDGTRVDIIPNDSDEDENDTFEKLDNTQWLLKGKRIGLVNGSGDLYNTGNGINNILPKTNYSVYTDFMDSSPLELFYARKSPSLQINNAITFTNLNNPSDEMTISSDYISYRDILFRTPWIYDDGSTPLQDIKYYQYRLYDEDGELIDQSEETYSSELFGISNNYQTIMTWSFKGLESGADNNLLAKKYTIELAIVDEYGKEFLTYTDFKVYYNIETDIIPLNINLDCDEKAILVEANAPVYVDVIDRPDAVSSSDISGNYLIIPNGKVLEYGTVVGETDDLGEDIHITLSENLSLLTRFQLNSAFIDAIPVAGEREIIKFGSKRYTDVETKAYVIDEYKLTLASFITYYIDETTQKFASYPDQFKFRWYRKNGENVDGDYEILTCWESSTGEMKDYIKLNEMSQNFTTVTQLKYALQDNSIDSETGLRAFYVVNLNYDDYSQLKVSNVASTFTAVLRRMANDQEREDYCPEVLMEDNSTIKDGVKIIVNSYYIDGINMTDNFYSSGVYIYTNGLWKADYDTEYIFIEDVDSVDLIDKDGNQLTSDEKMEILNVPDYAHVQDDSTLYWTDTKMVDDNPTSSLYIDPITNDIMNEEVVYVENNHSNTQNYQTIKRSYFTLYFICDSSKKIPYLSQIKLEEISN